MENAFAAVSKQLNDADAVQTEAKENRCIIHCKKRNEGFKTSSKVQYVARVGNFIDGGEEYTGALQILKVILSYDYLWQNVRVKGGAYGCMSNFNRIGEGYLISYRDPNLEKTMEIYEGVVTRIIPIGAFVEFAPKKEGMVHISKLDKKRTEKVEDVCNVGDTIKVKFLGVDEKGRFNLSRKDALED